MRLGVRRFNPKEVKPDRIFMFLGKRGTGKSRLLNDIMWHIHKDVDFGIAMSPTMESLSGFREHMPESWVFDSFNSGKLETMLHMQRELAKQNKARHLFVVMDDCMYDKRVMKGTAIRDLFMNGRHLRVTFLNCVQYMMDMGPDLRTQVDYLFVLRENIHSNKMKLFKYFFGQFDSYKEFDRVLTRCTDDYSCLVLDNTRPGSSNICDSVFWYKADIDLPPFRMGKPLFWSLAARSAKPPAEREREAQERVHMQRQEAVEKQRGAQRITLVTRYDELGRPLKEDVLTLN
jgi:hypothetical protein